jgi:hypothetical protein
MPLVDALSITDAVASSGTPGAISPGRDTLAGASIACDGTSVPSGSRCPSRGLALAVLLGSARLAVHPADSRASGTSAVARCQVRRRLCGRGSAMAVLSPSPGPRRAVPPPA